MPKLTKILVVIGLLFSAGALSAQDSRWSISVGVGQSKTDVDTSDATSQGAATVVESDGDFSWYGSLGYKLNERWKVDIGYVDAGDARLDGTLTTGFPYRISYITSIYKLGATLNIPFNDRLAAEVQAGPYYFNVDADPRNISGASIKQTGYSGFAGVGLRLTLSPQVSAHADYSYYFGDAKIRTATLGIRFGL